MDWLRKFHISTWMHINPNWKITEAYIPANAASLGFIFIIFLFHDENV